MSYRIELRQHSYNGPPLASPVAAECYESVVKASRIAKQEAFVLSNTLGIAVAVMIYDGDKTIIRHVVPARHDETKQPLYSRQGLHTTMEGEARAADTPAGQHPLIATSVRPGAQRPISPDREPVGEAAAA